MLASMIFSIKFREDESRPSSRRNFQAKHVKQFVSAHFFEKPREISPRGFLKSYANPRTTFRSSHRDVFRIVQTQSFVDVDGSLAQRV